MAYKLQALAVLGQRLVLTTLLNIGVLIERIVKSSYVIVDIVVATSSAIGSAMQPVQKAGHIVKLPDGTRFKPACQPAIGPEIDLRLNPGLKRRLLLTPAIPMATSRVPPPILVESSGLILKLSRLIGALSCLIVELSR